MHRKVSALTATLTAFVMLFAGAADIAAQEGTPPPAPTFADTMGLPELQVQVTDTSFEGLPAETPAGRYVVTANVTSAQGGSVGFLMLPEGMTFDDFMAFLGGPPASPEAGMATPGLEGSPPAGPPGGGAPEWYYSAKIAGGTGGGPGQMVQVIIDLTPGNWVVWGDNPGAPQTPVPLTVTGEEGATPSAAEPPAAITVTMFEYGFNVEGTLSPGPQAIKVTNVGAQPHFMQMFRSPVPVTKEQIGELLALDAQGATPAPDSGLPNPAEFMDAAFMATMSTGTVGWVPANLEPGYYILVCFIPDISSGLPHAFEGMYEVFEVTE